MNRTKLHEKGGEHGPKTHALFDVDRVSSLKGYNPLTVASWIQEQHRLAYAAARDALEHARVAGELLIAVKQDLPHGQFLPWVCKWMTMVGGRGGTTHLGPRQAQKYMRLAREWDSINAKSNSHLMTGGIDVALKEIAKRKRLTVTTTEPPTLKKNYRELAIVWNAFGYAWSCASPHARQTLVEMLNLTYAEEQLGVYVHCLGNLMTTHLSSFAEDHMEDIFDALASDGIRAADLAPLKDFIERLYAHAENEQTQEAEATKGSRARRKRNRGVPMDGPTVMMGASPWMLQRNIDPLMDSTVELI